MSFSVKLHVFNYSFLRACFRTLRTAMVRAGYTFGLVLNTEKDAGACYLLVRQIAKP